MATAMNVSLPCSSYKRFLGIVLLRLMDFNSSRILSPLGCGRLLILVILSKTQPRISLQVSQVPSSRSFLVEMGGPILLPVSYGCGKMSVMACSRHCVSLVISSLSVVCMRATKSSMYTSSRCKNERFCPLAWEVCPS